MHRYGGTFHDHAGESTDRLMTEAHPKDGDPAAEPIEDRLACAGLIRRDRECPRYQGTFLTRFVWLSDPLEIRVLGRL